MGQTSLRTPRVIRASGTSRATNFGQPIESSKVLEGHHPRHSATLSEETCLSEGSAGVSQRALRGSLRGLCGGLSEGSAGSLRGFCGVSPRVLRGLSEGSEVALRGSTGFSEVFWGSYPMLVTLANCLRKPAKHFKTRMLVSSGRPAPQALLSQSKSWKKINMLAQTSMIRENFKRVA